MESKTLSDSLRDTLNVFDTAGTPRTTPEVAEELGLERRTTYARLERLVEEGRLKTKKAGASGRVWWRPPTGIGGITENASKSGGLFIGDILTDINVGLFVLDGNFDVAWVNEAAEQYFGLDRERAIGRDKRQLIDEQTAPVVENADEFTETLLATYDDNTHTERFECHVTPDDDQAERWLEHRSKPIESGEYAGGRIELYYDITERKRNERAQREEHEQLESLIDAVEEYAIFTLDTDGYVQTWNPGAERIKGYAREEIVGEHISVFYTAEDAAAGVPEEYLAQAARNESVENEGWRVRKDGSTFWANVTLSAIHDDTGEVVGYAKVTRDMSERREREEQLREEKAFTESLFDNQRDILYAYDTKGNLLRWNDRFEEVAGYTSEEMTRKSSISFVAEEAVERTSAAVKRVLDGESLTIEVPFLTADGETIPYEFTVTPFVKDGEIIGFTGIGRDISDRKAKENRLERQREELERELDEVFQRIDDAMVGLDEEWQFTYVNDHARELLGTQEGDLAGQSIWDVFPDALDRSFRDQYERALATNESVTFEEYFEAGEAWLEVTAYPSESGLSIYFKDISERKERERELERYETIVERVDDGVYALDDEENFVMANDAFLEMTGYDWEELLGKPGQVVHNADVNEAAANQAEDVMTGEREGGVLEFDLVTKDGDTIPVESRFGPYSYEDDRYARCGIVRDITERKERERELEESRRRLQTIVENFPNGAVGLVDHDLRYMTFGGTLEGSTQKSREKIEGTPLREEVPPEVADIVAPGYKDALDGEPSTFESTIDGSTYQFQFVPVRDDDGEVFAAMGMSQDITSRKEYERYLEDSKSQLEAATEAGAIGTWEWYASEGKIVVGPSFAEIFDIDPAAAREGVSREQFIAAIHEDDRERAKSDIEAAFDNCGEYKSEYRVTDADGETRWVVARGHVECDADGNPVTFPGALTDITEQKEAEIELEQRRQQLAALNNLNEVIQDITSAVIEESTREEIEATVCERLAASDSYKFAWICEIDAAAGTLIPRAEVGVDGYLDSISLSINADDSVGQGPAGRAVRTGEIQVANAFEDELFEPWRQSAVEYGYQSSAAIPIVHEGTLYGILGIYADRPRAFDGKERDVISQLGEITGHAIGATERKLALISDELVEIEFKIPDLLTTFDIADGTDGTITIDSTVPVGDDNFLVYGTVTPDARELLTSLTERIPHWDSVTITSEGDPASFELRLTNPPVLSVVADRGGYVDSASIEDGDYQMTIHLAPIVNVREVINEVMEAYPEAEMLKRQQISRDRDDPHVTQRHHLSELTDRQRTALEAAYHSGFFEWPRDTSGENVAESMGIAPPTFHQHLRKAERKILESVFQSPAPSEA